MNNNDTAAPVRAYLVGWETITHVLLGASDARDNATVEAMLAELRQQVAALTPWADARICTSCWHAIPAGRVAHPGRDHRGICTECWHAQHDGARDPNAILSEN